MVLGRPTMASEGTFDVRLVPGTLHGDGSENPFVHYQQASIALMQLVDETVNKASVFPLHLFVQTLTDVFVSASESLRHRMQPFSTWTESTDIGFQSSIRPWIGGSHTIRPAMRHFGNGALPINDTSARHTI